MTRPRPRLSIRANFGLGLAAVAVVVLVFAFADPHRGLDPDAWNACLFRRVTGVRCFLCGMTTGFGHLAEGDVGAAAHAHPGALVLFPATALIGILGLVGAATRRDRVGCVGWLARRRFWLVIGLPLIVLAWAWRLLN